MSFLKTTPELISYKQLRLFVGLTGFLLPLVLIAGDTIEQNAFDPRSSVSIYYYSCMGDVFVGMLCAVAIFLFTYKGHDKEEGEWLSDSLTGNLACIFALGVALFPTSQIEGEITNTSWIHYICAGLFFTTLAYFSLAKFTRSKGKFTPMKDLRNKIYKFCGWTIVICIFMLLIYNIPAMKTAVKDTAYFILFEILALWAFAFSWLVKAEIFFPDKKPQPDDLSIN